MENDEARDGGIDFSGDGKLASIQPTVRPIQHVDDPGDAAPAVNDVITQHKLDAALFRQEHRTLVILGNFFSLWSYPKGDPRRNAIWSAFCWWLVGRVGLKTVVVGAAATVAVLNWTTIFDLYNTYLAWEANAISKNQTRFEWALDQREQYSSRLDYLLLEIAKLSPNERPSAQIEAQIVSFVNGFQPYKTPIERENGDVSVSDEVESIERGEVLRALAEARANANEIYRRADFSFAAVKGDFRDRDIDDAMLFKATLAGSRFDQGSLEASMLNRANVAGASFVGTNLSYSHFIGADLTGADLRGANLSHCRLDSAVLKGAKLQGAIVDSHDWLTKMAEKETPPKDLDFAQWTVVEVRDEDGKAVFKLEPTRDR